MMKGVRVFLIITFFIGSILMGFLSYGIGERGGHSHDIYGGSDDEATYRDSGHFWLGFFAGMILLLPIVLAVFKKTRREYLEQRKLESRHPLNVSIVLISGISVALFASAYYTFWNSEYEWENFGEALLIQAFYFYTIILTTAGGVGMILMRYESDAFVYGLVSVIATYAIFISKCYQIWYIRKQREAMIVKITSRYPHGYEIPVIEIASVLMVNPIKVRPMILRLIRKDTIKCSIRKWRVILNGPGDGAVTANPGMTARYSDSILPIKDMRWRGSSIRPLFPDTLFSGKSESCYRCGTPLRGEEHCPSCGYRNLFSYYDTFSPKFSAITTWIASRRGGRDPLGNALIALVIACAGCTLLFGILNVMVNYGTDHEFRIFRVDFLIGILAGISIAPFFFLPTYNMIKKELFKQRKLLSNDRTLIIWNTHFLVSVMIILSIIIGVYAIDSSRGDEEMVVLAIFFFYLSLASGGMLVLSLILLEFSGEPDMVLSGILLLLATWAYYVGIIIAYTRKEEPLPGEMVTAKGKQVNEAIVSHLATFRPGDWIPLHILGRMVSMEPLRIKGLIRNLILKGYVVGSLSGYHIRYESLTHFPRFGVHSNRSR